jgi:hypothetical protein
MVLSRWRAALVGAVLAGTVAAVLAVANPAVAGGDPELGALWIHGAGSAFAGGGTDTFMTEPTTAGGTATYTIEVVNEGSAVAEFKVALTSGNPGPTLSLKAGSLEAAPAAEGQNGYITNPIAPTKHQLLKLRVTTPPTATPTDEYQTGVTLSDTVGDLLAYDHIYTTIKAKTGTTSPDLYTATPGGAEVLAEPSHLISLTTAKAIQGTAKAKFTVKVQNDGLTPTSFGLVLASGAPCGVAFPITAKVGTTDVTAALENGTYATPDLAHGKNVTIAVSVGIPAETYTYCRYDFYELHATAGAGVSSSSEMIVNLIARLPSIAT